MNDLNLNVVNYFIAASFSFVLGIIILLIVHFELRPLKPPYRIITHLGMIACTAAIATARCLSLEDDGNPRNLVLCAIFVYVVALVGGLYFYSVNPMEKRDSGVLLLFSWAALGIWNIFTLNVLNIFAGSFTWIVITVCAYYIHLPAESLDRTAYGLSIFFFLCGLVVWPLFDHNMSDSQV